MRVRDGLLRAFARNLGTQDSRLFRALRSLASGLRLNSAADDVGSLGRSEAMRARVYGTRQALRNLNVGTSLLNTADGALQEIRGLLQRGREIALQSASGTLTDSDRQYLQEEVLHIRQAIDQIARNTEFNGLKIFGQSVGYSYSPFISDDFSNLAGTDLGATTAQLLGGQVVLPYSTRAILADSFGDTSKINLGSTSADVDTAGGRVLLPWLLAAAASDTFGNTAQVNGALTTALVNTALGLVELNKVMTPAMGDTFTTTAGTNTVATTATVDTATGLVRQPQVTQALWSDSFTDLSQVDGALTTALLDTAIGMALLPTSWGGGLTDTFSNTSQTDLANTTSVVDTLGGLVRVGQTFNLWSADSFSNTTKVDAASTVTVDTANGWATLPVVNTGLWTDTFADLSQVNGGSTTAAVNTSTGDVQLPTSWSGAKTDTFTDTAQVNLAATTALVQTAMGLVQLGQVYTTLRTDSFADSSMIAANSAYLDPVNQWLTLPTVSQTVLSDSFGDNSLLNLGSTTATVDNAGGRIRLPQLWGTGKADTFADSTQIAGGSAFYNAAGQLLEMSKVLNQRYTNSFTDLSGTAGALTTASVNTAGGHVTAPMINQILMSDTFSTLAGTNGGATTAAVDTAGGWVQLAGQPPTATTLGSDSFTDLTSVAAGTTVTVDTTAGTAALGTETFTVATNLLDNTSQIDLANTTAVVSGGEAQLPLLTGTETIATETFANTSQMNTVQTTATVSSGEVAMTSSLVTVGSDSFADGSQIDWTLSSGIHVTSTGDLVLGPAALTNQKYDPSGTAGIQAVFTPGTGTPGQFDSLGVYGTSVVDLGGGNLRMFYVTSKQANSTPGIGTATSSDGGQTWTLGVQAMGIGTITTADEIDVVYDGTTYTMFQSRADGIYVTTSNDGVTWAAGTKLSIAAAPAYTSFGRPTIVQDDAGTYHMFYETNGGIEHATSNSLTSGWTDVAGWTNLTGSEPELVKETLAPGVSQYALYTRDAGGNIERRTSRDFSTWSATTDVVTTAAGFASNNVHVGGAVYDSNTGVTRMVYYGASAAGAEGAVGLAYATGRTSGTMVSTVLNSTDTVQNVTFNATANTTGGTITYQVSSDGGSTWTAVTSGSTIALAPDQGLKLRISMTNTSGNIAAGPSVSAYTLQSQLYTTPQQVVSSQYTFAKPTDNITLNVNQTVPAGTGVSYFYSTDGTTWNAFTPGVQVNLGTPSSTFYVRAELSTTDRGITPSIQDWTLTTQTTSYPASSTLTTQNYTFADSIGSFDLAATQDTNGGTAIQWQYSTDGGTTWTNAAVGTNTLGAPTQQLKLRAVMQSSADQLFTPHIYDYQVTASRHVTPQTLVSTNYTFADAVNKVTLGTSQSTPAGTGIAYEISTDNGTTWQAITPGSELTLGTATTQVKLRATFSATDRYDTPTLSDYTLTGTTVGHAGTSVWTSTITNPGFNVNNVTLTTNQTAPAGTGITYELSTNGGGSWQAITPGANIAVIPGSQLVLRATLTSTDPAATPRLLDYQLTTNVYQNSTQWVSDTIATPYNATAVKLSATETKPAGTNIQYEVSSDNGLSWQAATNGVITNLGTAGSQLRIRATFTSTDPNVAARLDDIKLETYDYATANTHQSTYSTVTAATNQVQLLANEVLAAGTDILYEVTNDGGATWMAVNPGDTATFAGTGNLVGLRATLLGGGDATPQLLDYALNVPGYETDKWVYSSVQNLADPITNVTLSANAVTPGGTGVAYQVSTNGGTTWTTVTNGVNTVVPAGNQLVFRANLTTADPAFTPELLDYTLTTNASQSGKQMTSTTVNLAEPSQYFRLNVTENTPAGTDILYELSADGGATWVAATPGVDVDMGGFVGTIQLRATFTSTDPQNLAAPRLLDYTLQAKQYASAQTLETTWTNLATPATQLRLQANENLAAGTDILYELTNDGGATWVAVNPGDTVTFGAAGTQIGLRATLQSSGQYTPELLNYTLEIPGYDTGKHLYSTVHNFADPVTNVTFDATATTPAGTSITYEVSTNGGTTWQALTPGSNQAVTAGTQLVFRAQLNTADPSVTPTLHDYSFSTNASQSGSQLISTVSALPQPVRYLRLGVSENTPAGTDIGYELSIDGGATWVAAVPGAIVDMGAYGDQLRMRATFTTTDPQNLAVPRLMDYQIESYDYAATQTFQSTVQNLSAPTNQVRLTVNETEPAGTSISYFASVDGGTTWDLITAGDNTLSASGSQLVFRAVMNTNGQATPELLNYSLEVPGYESPRYVYSTVQTFGSAVDNVTLNVNANSPAGTGVSYDLSTDGGTTWQAITAGVNTALASPGTQLQLRARLSTTDPNVTPQLLDYSLTTNQNTNGAAWYSTVQTTANNVSAVRLNVNQNVPAGTTIAYSISADGGTTWQAIAPGALTNLTATSGNQLVLRATFNSSDPAHVTSADLLDYSLEIQEYAPSQIVQSTTFSLGQVTNQIQLDVSESVPAGSGITYEVSLNGGTTWETVTPGTPTMLGHSGDQAIVKATLSGNGAVTPRLLDYSLSVPGYESPRWVYSTVQNMAAPVYNVTLSATDLRPAGSGITYQVSANGGTTWTTVTPGVETTLAAPGTQLVLRAQLSTTDPYVSPELLDWSLTTNDYAPAGTWQSITHASATPVESALLTLNQTLPGSTGANYQISNDGGTTWYNAAPGTEVFFANPGSNLVVRADLSSANPGFTPGVNAFTLSTRNGTPSYLTRDYRLQAGAEIDETLTISFDAVESAAIGFDKANVSSQSLAQRTVEVTDQALEKVTSLSSAVGAMVNRLEHAKDNAMSTESALTAGLGRLVDADMAHETMVLVRAQMQLESATMVLDEALNARRQQYVVLLSMPNLLQTDTEIPERPRKTMTVGENDA